MSPGHPPLSQPDPSLQAYAWKVWDRIAVIGNEALRRSAPLFYEPTPGKLSFLASSVVLGVGEARFLVTAGHALDEFLGKPLYAGGETELVALGGKWVHSRMPPEGRDRDHIDLAVFRLDEATIRQLGLECVSPADTDPAYQPDPRAGIGTYYICVGFPKARQSTWIKDGMLKPPKQLYLTLKPGPSVESFGHPYNSLHNLALEFEKQAALANGEIVEAPDPVGMSGGGVWACNGLVGPNPLPARLVGISTTWLPKREAIIVTRVGLCYDAIADHFPELIPELPRPV
jgi:hypothetical protein